MVTVQTVETIAVEVVAPNFYDSCSCSLETRILLQQREHRINSIFELSRFEIGQELLSAKALLDHGQFTVWVESQFANKFSVRTARRMMAVAEAFKADTVSALPIDDSALYVLATAPEAVRQEAIAEAESGERITQAKAKALIAKSSFAPGQQVFIADTTSPQFQQSVTVDAVQGDIVMCTSTDSTRPIPFFRQELTPHLPQPSAPSPQPSAPKPKPNNALEIIEVQLEVEKARSIALEQLLRKIVEACQDYSIQALPSSLLPLIREAETLL